MSELDESLSERFREYQYFRNQGAYRSAVIRLGEIYHCLPKLNPVERSMWQKRITEETLPVEFIHGAKIGVENDAQRIRRILAYGTEWNDDEVLQVLTLRIQIDIAVSFLNEVCFEGVIVPTNDIDERIEEISRTTANKRSFEIAIDLIKENWGLPIESRWTRKDL